MSPFSRGRADYLELGDNNVACYECGRKRKASTMRRHWQGYYVCPAHHEPRQEQDFVRNVLDNQMPPWTQPPAPTAFRVYCAPNDVTAIASYAVATCMIAGYVSPMFDPAATY